MYLKVKLKNFIIAHINAQKAHSRIEATDLLLNYCQLF